MKTFNLFHIAVLTLISGIAEGYEVEIAPARSGDDDSGFWLEMERASDGKSSAAWVEGATTINVESGKYRVMLSAGDDSILGLCYCSFELEVNEDIQLTMGLPEMRADVAIPDALIPPGARAVSGCLGCVLEGEVYSEAMQRTICCTPEFLVKKGADGTWTGQVYFVLPGVYKLSVIHEDCSTKPIGTVLIDIDGTVTIKE